MPSPYFTNQGHSPVTSRAHSTREPAASLPFVRGARFNAGSPLIPVLRRSSCAEFDPVFCHSGCDSVCRPRSACNCLPPSAIDGETVLVNKDRFASRCGILSPDLGSTTPHARAFEENIPDERGWLGTTVNPTRKRTRLVRKLVSVGSPFNSHTIHFIFSSIFTFPCYFRRNTLRVQRRRAHKYLMKSPPPPQYGS